MPTTTDKKKPLMNADGSQVSPTPEIPSELVMHVRDAMVQAAFDIRKLDEDHRARVERLGKAGAALGELIVLSCPGCADRTAAIRKLREAVWTAQAAIATRGRAG